MNTSPKRKFSFALPAILVSTVLYAIVNLFDSDISLTVSSGTQVMYALGVGIVAGFLLSVFLYLIYRYIVSKKQDDSLKLWLTYTIGTACFIASALFS